MFHNFVRSYKNYELDKATRPIADLIDDISVWYLRRSRDRLKGDDEADKKLALGTLRYVLQELSKIMAPVMPFYAEYLWQAVKEKGDTESVHLTAWPETRTVDVAGIDAMEMTRKVVTLALDARTKANIKVRQPLQTLFVKQELHAAGAAYHELIMDEVNVKELANDRMLEGEVKLDTTLTSELVAEGNAREFIRAVQDMRKKADLQPADRISLTVSTTEVGQSTLLMHQDMILKTVGSDVLIFAEIEGETITAGEHTFVVSLIKI